jgi:hypothetical protein
MMDFQICSQVKRALALGPPRFARRACQNCPSKEMHLDRDGYLAIELKRTRDDYYATVVSRSKVRTFG